MDAFRSSSQRRFYSFRFENTCCRWVQKSLVFRLTDSTAIVFAFVISEERSLVIQLILSMLPSKVSYWFTKGITLQKRTQLLILKIDFATENRTQSQWTNHFVTRVFCSDLDLNTAVLVEIFVWYTRFFFVELNRTGNFHLFLTWVRCITSLGKASWR